MAFVLLSRSRSKLQGSVRPAPQRKSARGQHSADSRFGFEKPAFQSYSAALPTVSMIQTKLKIGETNHKFEDETARVAELTRTDGVPILAFAVPMNRSPVGSLQRLHSNQAVFQMRNGSGGPRASSVSLHPSQGGILQRKCACGGVAGMVGECEECTKKKRLGLQTKLQISEPGDIYEREADRIADLVLATPAHPGVSGTLPRVQRFSGQSNGQMDVAPGSVDQALASPGKPLESALRQDMERRFGHEFSQVRVHTDAHAAESARSVHALAYTVGCDVVFGSGQYAPRTTQGQRLLAHELTHVVQQLGNRPTVQGVLMMDRQGNGLEHETDNVARETLHGSAPAVNRSGRIQPIIQKKDNGDAIELEFVTVDPVEEARLKKMGITLPPSIRQTNPEDKCPKGYQPMKRATWFRCDESAGTKSLGCAFCTPQGQQCKCTDLLQSLGHNRIIAPRKSGQCGDWFKITSPKKGAPILDVIKAEIPGGDTDLDIHRDVIKQLGEDVDAGRYDVCLKGPEIHDDRLVLCGGSKCPTPKSSRKKKG